MTNIKIKNNNYCAICGAAFIPDGITAGYGINKNGDKICFKCCGDIDKKELSDLQPGDKMYLYLTSEKGVQRSIWFSFNGKNYFGKQYGNCQECCMVKRIK